MQWRRRGLRGRITAQLRDLIGQPAILSFLIGDLLSQFALAARGVFLRGSQFLAQMPVFKQQPSPASCDQHYRQRCGESEGKLGFQWEREKSLSPNRIFNSS